MKTRQLVEFEQHELYTWQKKVLAFCAEKDLHTIHFVFVPKGNVGKSVFCEWLEYHDHAYELPPMNSMRDMMQCWMGAPESKTYLINMPRALKKDKLGQMYSGIECIKNGVCYDKRYAFKKNRLVRPNIIVFANMYPDFSCISVDRWNLYQIDEDYDLFPVTIEDAIKQKRGQKRPHSEDKA